MGPTINRFLRSVTRIDDDTGYLDIQYRHSALTAALVDAGWLTGSREYAVGADPFKLPKLLRYLALRRFGRAFDDAGSWPRAAAHIIPLHRGLGLVLVNNRETILRGLGAILLPLRDADEQRRGIKRLFSRLELDGTYDAWARGYPDVVALPDPRGHGPLIPLAGRIVFPVRHYLRQQPERTEWLAQRLRPMCDLIEYWNSATGGNEHPERTLKEEALAEWEAISRRAKRRWAEANGHDCISLQHDGIALALRATAWSRARPRGGVPRRRCLPCARLPNAGHP